MTFEHNSSTQVLLVDNVGMAGVGWLTCGGKCVLSDIEGSLSAEGS